MKILVTGACGGIGSHLVPHLLEQGNEVHALDDLSSGKWSNLSDRQGLTKHTVDISNTRAVNDFAELHSFQIVYHLAAISSLPECQVDPIRAFHVNFQGTVNLVNAAKKQRDFVKFVFASTSAVYENTPISPFEESHEVSPLLVYPQTKLYSENYLKAEAETSGFPSAIVRIFNVFGDYQNSSRQSPPILNYIVRELIANRVPVLHGNGEQARDFISVDDVVDFLIRLITINHAPGDIVNLCRGELVSVNSIYEAAAKALGYSGRPNYAQPSELWVAYPELFQGAWPLDKNYVAREVAKTSLGDSSKLLENYKWKTSDEVVKQVAAIAVRMKKHLEGSSGYSS
jgi:nucleoside-diphosphate-sugar epimerase